MKKGTYVRLLRLVLTPDSVPGFVETKPTVPMKAQPGCWVEGYLAENIALGSSIRLEKHILNGKEVRGVFRTSPVCLTRGDEIFTQMAAYRLLKAPPFDPVGSLQAWEE